MCTAFTITIPIVKLLIIMLVIVKVVIVVGVESRRVRIRK